MKSIYLLGSERSGSNLLRKLIGNHSKISAPVAPHLCDAFGKIYKSYLPFSKNKSKLLADMETFVNHDYNRWGLTMNKEEVISNYSLNSIIEFAYAVYSEKAKAEKSSHFFSKDNHNHNYALGILKDIPDAKFIYLSRDPRDHTASWLRRPIHMYTPYIIINKWDAEQKAIFKLIEFFNVEMCCVRYEDLIANPEKEMSKILTFLDLDIEKACFNTNKKSEEAERNPFWKNLNQPIMNKNSGKYLKYLNGKKLNMVETIAKDSMARLNYTSETNQDWRPIFGNRVFNLSNILLEKVRSRKNQKFLKNEMKEMLDKNKLINSFVTNFKN